MKKLVIIPDQQTGHICKPTAIANIDKHYAMRFSFNRIPLNKKHNPLNPEYKEYHTSLRQLAKKYGSIQGELLQMEQVEKLLEFIGYQVDRVDFQRNWQVFKTTIINNIQAGHIIFAAFAVDTVDNIGKPTTNPGTADKNEHAAVIHGYDEQQNLIYFTHWGKEWEDNFENFYESSMVLLPERQPEYYIKVKENSSKKYKYDAATEITPDAIKSIEPKLGTGFRAKLIVVKMPENLEEFKKNRLAILQNQPQLQVQEQEKYTIQQNISNIPQAKHDELNIKHVAQIFLEEDLPGTSLEGAVLIDNVILLNEFVNWLQTTSANHTSIAMIIRKLSYVPPIQNQDFLCALQYHLNAIYGFAIQKSAISNKYLDLDIVDLANLNKVEQELHSIAKNLLHELRQRGDVFIAGGFSGNPGHSLMYRLNQQKESIYFCVYDSSNQDFHESELLESFKIGHYPIYAFSIPNVTEDLTLEQFLVALFKFEVLPRINKAQFSFTERDLYQILYSAPSWLNGAVLPADKFSKATLQQFSGTCVWRSLEQFLNSLIPDPEHYRQFLLAYKLYRFSETHSRLTDLKLIEPSIKILLKRSLARLAKMINHENKHALKFPLGKTDIDTIIVNLRCWKSALATTQPKKNEHVTVDHNQSDKDPSSFSIDYMLPTYINSIANNCARHIQPLQYPSATMQFDRALITLYQLLMVPNIHLATATSSLEKFCLHFSNPQQKITLEESNIDLDFQIGLIGIFLKILKRYNILQPKLVPSKVILYLSLMNIVDRLGVAQVFKFGNITLMGSALFAEQLSEFVKNISINPFLSSFNPKLDIILERLRKYHNDERKNQDPISYYADLCDQANQEEKNVLKQHWAAISGNHKESVELITAVNKFFYKHRPEYYCYFDLDERAKILNNIPELHNAFKLQRGIGKFIITCLLQISLKMDKYSMIFRPILDASNIGIWLHKEYAHDPNLNEKIVHLELLGDQLSHINPKCDWFFLRRDLLEKHDKQDNLANLVLLTGYDGYVSNSQIIPYTRTVFNEACVIDPTVKKPYQLITHLDPEQYLTNLLHHIHISSSCKVVILLSELCNHQYWLDNPDWERYIFLSIFQPGILLEALTNGSDLWTILEQLWLQNQEIYPERNWVILKLASMIAGYAATGIKCNLIISSSVPEISPHIELWKNRLLPAVELRKANLTQQNDIDKLRELHYLRLQALLIEDKVEEAFIESYCFLILSDNSLTAREEDYVRQLLEQAAPCIAEYKKSTRQKTWPSLEKFGIVDLKQQIYCTTHSVYINGQINNLLPTSLCNYPEFRELFKQQRPQAQKNLTTIDDSELAVYSWSNANCMYRVLFMEQTGMFMLQKQMKNLWYTYTATSKATQAFLKFQHAAFTKPPKLLNQTNLRAWVADDLNWMVTKVGEDSDILYEKHRGKFTFTTMKYEPLLLRFEDQEFISTTIKNNIQHFYFERYGLELIKDRSDYFTADKKYSVIQNPKYDWFGSGLLLLNKISATHELIIPIQPYFVQKNQHGAPECSSSGTQYIWVHDLSNHIKQNMLLGKNAASEDLGWDYSNSEQYAKFCVDEIGGLTANSSQNQIYLAYLYAAQDRPKRALECIRSCIIQGNFMEMERLWWIVDKLPAEERYKIRNPRIVAVQLAALHAMLQIDKQFPAWITHAATPISSDKNSNTTRCNALNQTQLLSFVNRLPQHIENYYIMYHILRDITPLNLHLRLAEEKILLAYWKAHQENLPQHGYALILYNKYWEHFISQDGQIKFYVRRHTMHQAKYTIGQPYWFSWSSTINTTTHVNLDTSINPENANLLQLHPYMNEIELLKKFSFYYTLALTAGDVMVIKKLKDFCATAQTLYAKIDHKNRERDQCFLLVSEIIWAVLHAGEAFPDRFDPSKNLSQIITELCNIAIEHSAKIPNISQYVIQSEFVIRKHAIKMQGQQQHVHAGMYNENIQLNAVIKLPNNFSKAYSELLATNDEYQLKENNLLAQNQLLYQTSFERWQAAHAELNNDFLNLQKNKEIQQRKILINNNIVLFDNIFSKIRRELINNIAVMQNAIKAILANRTLDLAEFAKTKIIPSVGNLLRLSDKLQTDDLCKLGIPADVIPKLLTCIQRLIISNNTYKRLCIFEETLQSYTVQATTEKHQKLVKAFLNLQTVSQIHRSLFESINKLSLHQEQVQILNLMENIEGKSKVLQLIMGGGKTKAILPLWAYRIANGENLVIILVPDMSLHTNFIDLSSVSRQSFQQIAYCLRFDCNLQNSPLLLQELYETLETIRREKGYVVTTAAMLQSMELKYIEILDQKPASDLIATQREEQLLWLGNILKLLKNKGIVAIDEAHVLLNIKKELNYAFGGNAAPANEDLDLIINLYMWIDGKDRDRNNFLSLADQTRCAQTKDLPKIGNYFGHDPKQNIIQKYVADPSDIMDDTKINNLMKFYIKDLCAATLQPDAPSWIKDLLPAALDKSILEDYLSGLDPAPSTIEYFKQATQGPILVKQWTLLRNQLQILLPITLRRKIFEHYGPAKESEIKFAIPYRANNVPTQFVFGNVFEAMNYTVQMILYRGITLHDLQSLLIQWRKDADMERRYNATQLSLAEKKFLQLNLDMNKYSNLLTLNLNDLQLIQQLHQTLGHNQTLLREVIRHSLQSLRIENKILRSDSINLVSQFKHVAALTGTPSNHRTYHKDVQLVHSTTLGVEAQVISYLKRTKTAPQYATPQSIQDFIKSKFTDGCRIYAIIDSGGFFRGMNNLSVAKMLADLCEQSKRKHMKYILFYQGDKLFSWSIGDKCCKQLSSTYATTIQMELQCAAHERMTYYDQEHTLGSDIAQDDTACGILTVDFVDDELSKMLQAAMRMRGLGGRQSLIIAVNQSNLSTDTLIKHLRENEGRVLQEEHFRAGLKKIADVFRNDLLTRIEIATSPEQRDAIFQHAKEFLVQENTLDIHTAFAQSLNRQSTMTVLTNFAMQKKDQWIKILNDLKLETSELCATIDAIIRETFLNSLPNQHSHFAQLGQEIQMLHEQQIEIQTQQQTLKEQIHPNITLNPINCTWLNLYLTGSDASSSVSLISSAIARQYPEIENFNLSNNLYASLNFMYTHSKHTEFYNAYTKPGLGILFSVTADGNVRGILLCMEEIEIAQKYILQNDLNAFPAHCLMTLNGHQYHRVSSKIQAHHQLQMREILEQAQFITGNLNALLSKEPSMWMTDQLESKILFLNKIATFVDISPNNIQHLRNHHIPAASSNNGSKLQ